MLGIEDKVSGANLILGIGPTSTPATVIYSRLFCLTCFLTALRCSSNSCCVAAIHLSSQRDQLSCSVRPQHNSTYVLRILYGWKFLRVREEVLRRVGSSLSDIDVR